jgi:GAF domain-containing protein
MTEPPAEPSDDAVVALRSLARRVAAAGRLDPSATDPWLASVVETAAMALDAEAASVAVHDPATDRLVFRAAAGPAAGAVVGLSIDAASGIAGYAFTSGQPIAIADVQADPRFDRTVAEATGYQPGTLLAVPLADERGIVGVLEVLDRRGGSFDLRDLDLAAGFARQATIAIRADRLGRDTGTILAAALRALDAATPQRDGDPASAALDDARIETLVSAATTDLADTDDPIWALADRIARLDTVDPELTELATEWLDALLRQRERASRGGRRGRARG